MITITLLWNMKKFRTITANRNDINERIISVTAEKCSKENISGFNFTRFSKNTNNFVSTDLDDIHHGDKINVVAETEDNDELPQDHDNNEQPQDHDSNELPQDHDSNELPQDHDNNELPQDHLSVMKRISKGDNSSFEKQLRNKIHRNGFFDNDDRNYILNFFGFHENCKLSKKQRKRILNENRDVEKQPRKRRKTITAGTQTEIVPNDYREVRTYLELYPDLPLKAKNPGTLETFATMLHGERRAYVINYKPTAEILKQKYRFMFTYEQMVKEFELIIKKKDIYTKFECNVKKYCTCILASAPKNRRYKMVMEKIQEASNRSEKLRLQMAGSLLLLPAYMEENRKDILVSKKEDSNEQRIYPYIHCTSNLHSCLAETAPLRIVMEGVEVCKPPNLLKAYLALIAVYYVFNAEYYSDCRKTLSILEQLYIEHTDGQTEMDVDVEKRITELKQAVQASVR